MLFLSVAGMDGYLGWPLAMHLTMRGHQVHGVDNISRRRYVEEVGSWSATPIRSISERLVAFQNATSKKIGFSFGDLTDTANQWARNLVDNYAMSTREARFYLSAMQDLLVPMGMNADAAAKMSYEVAKLSADLASFNNMRTEDVMRDIQSALVGNFETMKKYGAVFKKNEPGGGIVGASGLLLGMGKLRGFKGTCFMGETPGYLVDPKSAKAVLKILTKITNIEIDLSQLEKKAKEIEAIAQQLKDMEGLSKEKSDDLRYIG